MEKKKVVMRKDAAGDLLDCIEHITEMSKGSKMNIEFKLKADLYIKKIAERMKITERQAVLFAICVQYGPNRIYMKELATHLDVSMVRILRYNDDLEELVRRKYLRFSDSDHDTFDIPNKVFDDLKHNKVYSPPPMTGLDCFELFDRMNPMFEELSEGVITCDIFYESLQELFNSNTQVGFVKQLGELKLLNREDWLLLVLFCHFCVNKDDNNIVFSDMEDIFDSNSEFNSTKSMLRSGNHPLMRRNLIEHVCENGMAMPHRFKLTDDAKRILLAELKMDGTSVNYTGLISPDSLAEKKMFYSKRVSRQVDEVTGYFQPEEFKLICERMQERGFRRGFACLFYGEPGTGKTETVYQLAKATGRSIFIVDVPQIKSKWVGDSEKNIKHIFLQYRLMAKKMDLTPIMLFNEADAIIGKRKNGATDAVDKMENSIQNIILQEMENLEGILIATTNLEANFDPAFERRFLYKIQFEKPDSQVRCRIWTTMVPGLRVKEAEELASQYDFSGGQIENIARKQAVFEILHGKPRNRIDLLRSYCDEEKLAKMNRRVAGFS